MAADMSWSNYGLLWEIDHKRPVVWFRAAADASAAEVDTIIRDCWSLSNIRPLLVSENRRKGGREFSGEIRNVG